MIVYLIEHIADIFNRVVGSSIHFSNVIDRFVFYTFTYITFKAGLTVYRVKAVYSFGKNFGTAGFTCTTCAGKDKSMACFARCNLIFQCFHHKFLPDNLTEGFWTVLSVQSYMHNLPPYFKIGQAINAFTRSALSHIQRELGIAGRIPLVLLGSPPDTVQGLPSCGPLCISDNAYSSVL